MDLAHRIQPDVAKHPVGIILPLEQVAQVDVGNTLRGSKAPRAQGHPAEA
jgi:hypothetical protein